MPIIEASTIVSIWGVLTGGYSVVSGITTSKSLDRISKRMLVDNSALSEKVTQVSERLSILEDRLVLTAANETEDYEYNTEDQGNLLQQSDILSSHSGDTIKSSRLIKKRTPNIGQCDKCILGSSRQPGSGFVVNAVWRPPVK